MLKKLTAVIFLLALSHAFVQAQDAMIYLYRKSKFKGAIVDYKVYVDSALVGQMTTGQVLMYRVSPGNHRVWGKTESVQETYIAVQAGKSYFIECGVAFGVVVGTPTFRQRQPTLAIADIAKINPNLKFDNTVTEAVLPAEAEALAKADTVSAVSNMFRRKRKAGNGWGIFFAASSTWTLAGGGGAAALPTVGLSILGFANGSKYTRPKLEALVKSYQHGSPLPAKIKKKLKEKDFK